MAAAQSAAEGAVYFSKILKGVFSEFSGQWVVYPLPPPIPDPWSTTSVKSTSVKSEVKRVILPITYSVYVKEFLLIMLYDNITIIYH